MKTQIKNREDLSQYLRTVNQIELLGRMCVRPVAIKLKERLGK